MLTDNEIQKIIETIKAEIAKGSEGLTFEPENHTYYFNGKEVPCVSEICEIFEKSFDEELWARKKAAELGISAEEVLKMWNTNTKRACDEGTEVHSYAEWHFYNHTGELIKDEELLAIEEAVKSGTMVKDERMECVDQVWEYIKKDPHLYPIASENRIFNEELGYAGTFDLLCLRVNDDDSYGLVIFDYKTNGNLFNIFKQRNGVLDKMNHPLSNVPACNAANYTCQLNLYQLGLERATNVPVVQRVLLWVEPVGVTAIHNNTQDVYQRAHHYLESKGKKSKWKYFGYYVNEIDNLKRNYHFRKIGKFAMLSLPEVKEPIRLHLKERVK